MDGQIRRYDVRFGKLVCDTIGSELVCDQCAARSCHALLVICLVELCLCVRHRLAAMWYVQFLHLLLAQLTAGVMYEFILISIYVYEEASGGICLACCFPIVIK